MNGEINLGTLLVAMRPILHESPYVFCSVSQNTYDNLSFSPLCMFREQEGITIITTEKQAIDDGLSFNTTWAWIALTAHSSLSAVGFLAAITGRLAKAGISVNPVSGYYHDHLFVPWESREIAINILKELSCSK